MDSISKRWGEISVHIVVILCTCTGSIVITSGGITKLSLTTLSIFSKAFLLIEKAISVRMITKFSSGRVRTRFWQYKIRKTSFIKIKNY